MKNMKKAVLGILLCVCLLTSIGCSATDPLTEDFYAKNIYTYNGTAWNLVQTGGVLAEVDPVFTASPAFGITALNIADWNGHSILITGIHGVGVGDVVGTTLSQNLTNKTLMSSIGEGTWTASGVWKLPAMYFNGDITTDRWLSNATNTFLGTGVAGNGNLAHTGGIEGWNNTGIGNWALHGITTGYYNTAVGDMSLSSITTGIGNTAVGEGSILMLQDGSFNTGIGSDTLVSLVSGDRNTALGMFAGYSTTGDDNVFIGYKAGYNEAGSDTLYIDNSDTITPLIYGNFSTDILQINGTLDMTLHQINNVADPTLPQDAATMNYVGNLFLRWEDLRTPVNAIKLSGTKPPSWTPYKSSEVLGFSYQAIAGNEEEIFFSVQLPHSYKEGTDIYAHIHWVASDNTGGVVRWQLTYSWANVDIAFPAATTIYLNATCSTVTDNHTLSSFASINGTGKLISSMLICSIRRNSSNAADTYVGKSAYFIEVDFHYQTDSMGSNSQLVK